MTVKIIKQGVPLEELTFESSCRLCGTKFSFQLEDAPERSVDLFGNLALDLPCPSCNHSISHTVKGRWVPQFTKSEPINGTGRAS